MFESLQRSLELLEVHVAQPLVMPNLPILRVNLSTWQRFRDWCLYSSGTL